LDTCLGSSEKPNARDSAISQPKTLETKQAIHATEKNDNVDASSDSKQGASVTAAGAAVAADVAKQPQQLVPTISQSPVTGPDAFSHMMKQSHRVFSTKEPLRQRFHLHSDGRLSWSDMEKEQSDGRNYKEAWSAKVLLKGSRMLHGDSPKHHVSGPQPRDVELTVSSSVPTGNAPTRLVKRHSRLSVSDSHLYCKVYSFKGHKTHYLTCNNDKQVPVLKSILQKSVRRRRPLPAVRVAMELMDKAVGELLRRLPIIVLEDSTLHPDLPLLCWIMVAESKVRVGM